MRFAALAVIASFQAAPPAPAKPELQPVPFTEYLAGFSSPVRDASRWVISNREEFQHYWGETLGRNPEATPKTIDFKRYVLVAIHIGVRATSGYNVFVKSLSKISPDTALVTYVVQKPRPLTVVVQKETSPWVLFRVPVGFSKFQYKEIVQTIKYPPVRENAKPGTPDPDGISHAPGG